MKIAYAIKSRMIFVCILLFFVYGCSITGNIPISFQSDPPGARIDIAYAVIPAESDLFSPYPKGPVVPAGAPFTPFEVNLKPN